MQESNWTSPKFVHFGPFKFNLRIPFIHKILCHLVMGQAGEYQASGYRPENMAHRSNSCYPWTISICRWVSITLYVRVVCSSHIWVSITLYVQVSQGPGPLAEIPPQKKNLIVLAGRFGVILGLSLTIRAQVQLLPYMGQWFKHKSNLTFHHCKQLLWLSLTR